MNRRRQARDRRLYRAALFFWLLPEAAAVNVFRALFKTGLLFSPRLRRQRDLVRNNIRLCLPGKTARERNRLAAAVARRTAADFHQAQVIRHPARLERLIGEARGLEHLDRALAAGKGVICLSAHFGNFPLLLAWLGRRGYPVNTIIRDFRNPFLEAHFKRARAKAGMRAIAKHPPALALRRAIRWLREGNILFILADQRGDQGVIAPLFGLPADTPAGPALLSRKLDCPVVPVSIRRRGGKNLVTVEPPLELERTGDFRRDAAARTVRFNRVIERWVREDPAQWSSWLNDRFGP